MDPQLQKEGDRTDLAHHQVDLRPRRQQQAIMAILACPAVLAFNLAPRAPDIASAQCAVRPRAQRVSVVNQIEDDLCSISLEPPSWRPPPREELISRLESEEYDVLVIGGGATGSGVALDAATRGLRVAMVEKNDFASGTSSRSTKLIHGGLRYLAQAFQKKIPPRSLLDVIANFHFKPEYLKIVAADLSERTLHEPFTIRSILTRSLITTVALVGDTVVASCSSYQL